MVVVLEGRVDLIAGGGGAGGEGEDAADGSHVEQGMQLVSGADQRLEADLLVAGAQGAEDFDGRGRGLRGLDSGAADFGRTWLGVRCVRRRSNADEFAFGSLGGFLDHAGGDGLEVVGDAGFALDVMGAMDDALDFGDVAGGFLDAEDVGVGGEFDDEFDGQIVAGALREAVEDDRQGRAVGHGAEVVEHDGRGHLGAVVVRGAHQDGVIAERGGELAGLDRLLHGLVSAAGDHHLFRGGGFDGGAEDLALLLAVEQHGLAGGAEDDDASDGAAAVALDVVFQLFEVETAVGVVGSRDGGKDSVEQHDVSL